VGTVSLKSEAAERSLDLLRTALGPITAWLKDPDIVEVMLNPDGRLWIDRLAGGLSDTGEQLSAEAGDRIIRVLADHVGAEVTARSPRLSAELPSISELPDGARFEGLIPPIVKAPTFAIRKPAVAIFTLAEYAEAAIMTAEEAEFLRNAVAGHSNILVAGGTSSGKTTLVNALLAEVAWTADRVILIEDTRELQCKAANFVALRTREDVVSMSDLVRSSLRLRPDRIPVGECAAAPRPSISSRRGGPVIRAGSARSTPRPRSERCTGSNNSSRSSSSPFPGR
jgi:type IV secretion system protein VirB11